MPWCWCCCRKDNEQLKSELALEMRSATRPTSHYEQDLLVRGGEGDDWCLSRQCSIIGGKALCF